MTDYSLETIQYYDSHAQEFLASISTANMSAACDQFISFLKPKARIMDLGCGTGRDSLYFASKGCFVLPVDASAEMCRITTENTKLQAQQIRFEELEYVEEFDGVWACASLLHASRESLPEIMSRINSALKLGGILYFSFKYGTGSAMKNGRYFTNMTEADLPWLCNERNGFKVEHVCVSNDVRPERSEEKWLNVFARKV